MIFAKLRYNYHMCSYFYEVLFRSVNTKMSKRQILFSDEFARIKRIVGIFSGVLAALVITATIIVIAVYRCVVHNHSMLHITVVINIFNEQKLTKSRFVTFISDDSKLNSLKTKLSTITDNRQN